ncbi:hypothetical protein G3I40_28380 [Streptomyces sp. SID14478]|uniref:hypothetical protein n=1 Tax=Streptomyces sp. SID14478 TaxID=2706073 RepID=UPI0013D9EC3B|nr:hypothetical protein [Streptomyces sp. SID14478]NEB79106.1 hypothetical protein [Streptomyces sp. SID14478]
MHDDHGSTSANIAQLSDAYWLSTPPLVRTHQPCAHCTPALPGPEARPRRTLCRHAHPVMTAVSVLTVATSVIATTR